MYKLGSAGRYIRLGDLLAGRQCETIGKNFERNIIKK
jgi:hypothetical protein